MNLREEVILTLLWQSGASESATVCFVISLSICYWLFKCRILQVVCVREREIDRVTSHHITSAIFIAACLCVCVCVREREREREGGSHHSRVYSPSEIVLIAACLQMQTHTSTFELCLYILTVFTIIWKAEARYYGKGRYISDAACGVRPITMHCASWPIRTDCACWKEGLCRKQSVWERRGIEDQQ